MKHIDSFLNEAKEIVLLSYIDNLKEKYEKNKDDENTYLEVTADLFKYLSNKTNEQFKSIMDQLDLEFSNNVDLNKSKILWYIIGEQ